MKSGKAQHHKPHTQYQDLPQPAVNEIPLDEYESFFADLTGHPNVIHSELLPLV